MARVSAVSESGSSLAAIQEEKSKKYRTADIGEIYKGVMKYYLEQIHGNGGEQDQQKQFTKDILDAQGRLHEAHRDHSENTRKIDYATDRIKHYKTAEKVAGWLESIFGNILNAKQTLGPFADKEFMGLSIKKVEDWFKNTIGISLSTVAAPFALLGTVLHTASDYSQGVLENDIKKAEAGQAKSEYEMHEAKQDTKETSKALSHAQTREGDLWEEAKDAAKTMSEKRFRL